MGCIAINEEGLESEYIYGCIFLDDWRPFVRMVSVLDYKNIVEDRLVDAGCFFIPSKITYELAEDPNYQMKTLYIPKYNKVNLYTFVTVIRDALYYILKAGGTEYKYLSNSLDKVFDED